MHWLQLILAILDTGRTSSTSGGDWMKGHIENLSQKDKKGIKRKKENECSSSSRFVKSSDDDEK